MDDDFLISDVLDKEFGGSRTFSVTVQTPPMMLICQGEHVTREAISVARIAAAVCRRLILNHEFDKHTGDRTTEVAGAIVAMTPAQRDQIHVLLDSMSDHGG